MFFLKNVCVAVHTGTSSALPAYVMSSQKLISFKKQLNSLSENSQKGSQFQDILHKLKKTKYFIHIFDVYYL